MKLNNLRTSIDIRYLFDKKINLDIFIQNKVFV